MSRAPLNDDGKREIRVDAWTIDLRTKERTELACFVVIADDTDEPVRNCPAVCALVCTAMCSVIRTVLPIPSYGRVEFSALGNVVRFYSDQTPTEDQGIQMTLNLLRETCEYQP